MKMKLSIIINFNLRKHIVFNRVFYSKEKNIKFIIYKFNML